MTRVLAFGERLFLPVLMKRRPREPRSPLERQLWVYVLDPASFGLRNPIARVPVPYEPLPRRISGERFAVDHQPLPDLLVKALDWPQRLVDEFAKPLDLDAPRYAVEGGVRPSTGEPLFAGQMVYAVCQRVYDTFAKALGRDPVWGPWARKRIGNGEAAQLRIRPFACFEANAYYDDEAGTLEFGFCHARADNQSPNVLPGGLVLLALSHDVIAHEVTHALLDGMRANFRLDTHPDVLAFHEAFSDIVALFHHFQYRELVEQTIEKGGELNSQLLLQLAREFGEAIHGREGSALRDAVESMAEDGGEKREILKLKDDEHEPHARGAVLVAAVFSAFLEVYQRRAETFFKLAARTRGAGAMPHELVVILADEACRIAADFLQICIRAIDYCPPTDIRFGEYLRAMITADRALNHVDRHGIRDSLIKAFRRRAIAIDHVRDLSEYSLEWNAPARTDLALESLAWSQLRLSNDGVTPQSVAEVERQANELARFILGSEEVLREFGVCKPDDTYGPITVESMRPVARRTDDGRLVHGLVTEVSQTRAGGFVGGATVIFDEDGVVQYAIRKRVDDEKRAAGAQRFRATAGRAGLTHFRNLHAHPGKPRG